MVHCIHAQYGIIATVQRGPAELFTHIVEKPKTEDAPSNLSSPGYYMLRQNIFEHVKRGMDHPGMEQFFTDPLNWYHQAGNDIAVIHAKGEYLDCGNTDAWLHTNQRVLGK